MRKLIQSQEHTIADYKKKFKEFEHLHYYQSVQRRTVDYEKEARKLRNVNKLKEV